MINYGLLVGVYVPGCPLTISEWPWVTKQSIPGDEIILNEALNINRMAFELNPLASDQKALYGTGGNMRNSIASQATRSSTSEILLRQYGELAAGFRPYSLFMSYSWVQKSNYIYIYYIKFFTSTSEHVTMWIHVTLFMSTSLRAPPKY